MANDRDKRKKPWKEFEILVARIEKQLAGEGAVVKSPDRIPDLLTGRSREVDASIRMNVGSTPILITVECRRRVSVQDDTWIEQLATKRQKVGANATIAVTATNFTKSAIKTAQYHNIELRHIKDVTDVVMKDWTERLRAVMTLHHWSNVEGLFHFQVPSEHEHALALEGKRIKLSDTMDTNGSIIIHRETSQAIGLDDLIQQVLKDQPWISESLVENDIPKEVTVTPFILVEPFYLQTNWGAMDIVGVEITMELQKETKIMPLYSAIEYSSPEGKILHLAEWQTIDSKGQTHTLSVIPVDESGKAIKEGFILPVA